MTFMVVTERGEFVDQEDIESRFEVTASMQRGCGKTDVNVKVVLKLSRGKRVPTTKKIFYAPVKIVSLSSLVFQITLFV